MGTKSFVQTRADWVRVLEAAADDAPDDRAWAEALIEAARPIFPRSPCVGFCVVPSGPSPEALMVAPSPVRLVPTHAEIVRAPAEAFDAFTHPPTVVCTQREILRLADPAVRDYFRDSGHSMRVPDAVGLVVRPTLDQSVALFAVTDEEFLLTRRERQLLLRLAMHVESGYRARRQRGAVKAVLTADGALRSRAVDAPTARSLERHVAGIVQARSRAARVDAEAIALWPALVEGRASLVPRGAPGRRSFEVVENPPASLLMRALSKGERDVLQACARGSSVKAISYALGMSPATVSSRLASAAAKLGLSSRLELLRVATILTGDARQTLSDADLSAAERDVLDLLQRGLSNAEIARLRSRSTRTVANQVASLLRKTKSQSRAELIAAQGMQPSKKPAAGTPKP